MTEEVDERENFLSVGEYNPSDFASKSPTVEDEAVVAAVIEKSSAGSVVASSHPVASACHIAFKVLSFYC